MATPAMFSTKPHVFDGTDFSHWYSRMQSYIMAEDYDIWRKVSHTYVIPEAINTAAKKTAFEQNCKARNILLSGISCSDYDRVAHLQNAHEIWVALSNFHQGTNNIKDLRRDLFKKEYIKFEMKPGKALDDYLSRFNKILSDFRSVDSSYDANYPQSEISRHFLNGLDMSIWEMKVTSIQDHSKSNALISSSSSLDVDASSSKSSFLAVFNATSDNQLEQIEEEDLALVANRIARAMNNARNRKRGGPNHCFECGSIDHLRSHCPKLGRGKREDKDGEKTNDNKPNNNKSKGSSQGRKLDNLRKAFQQVCAAFEPLSDVDGESRDDDKGKNISDVCFMAHGESDTEYEDNEVSAFEEAINILSAKNKKCEKMYRKHEFIIESLKSKIDRLKSLIPNDDDCSNCEVLMNEIPKIRDVNAAHDLKNISSLACSFALHTRTLDELFLTKKLLQKYQIVFHASLMFNMFSVKKLKQPHDVLDCSTCSLNKMKLKDALGRVEFMEDVVKKNEVLSCPKCRKSKGVMVDCENCANLEKEVSYLKNSLLRFSDGEKNLNMILEQSKVSTHNRGLGFNPYAHNSRHPPVVLSAGARSGEILVKPDTNKTVFKSAGIMSTLNASSSKSNVVNAKPSVVACVAKSSNSTNVSNHREKYTCSFCGKDGHIIGFCFKLAHKQKKEREIAFAKSKWQKSGFPSRKPVRPQWVPRSDRRPVRPSTERRSDRALVRPAVQRRSDWPPVRPATVPRHPRLNRLSLVMLLQVPFSLQVHFKKSGSKVFDSCGDSVLNISRYGRVFKADFENPVSPVVTCLVAKFDKDVMFWHRRLGHVGFDHLTRLSGLDLVHGLPKLKKDLDLVCTPCRHAKMVSTPHAPIVYVMTDAPGQLLHMDTVGPARVQSVGGKWFRGRMVVFLKMRVTTTTTTRLAWPVRPGARPVRPAQDVRSDRPGSSAEGSVDAVRDGPPEITTSTSTDTEHGSTSEVVAPLHIQRRHPPEQIIGNIGERTTRSKEEVYVKQPQGFENPDFPNHVFKLSKVLYGLKQAPRAWYDRLKNFLLAKGFAMGKVEKRLFVLKHGDNQLFVQIYVDDIIFGCSTHALVVDFVETMCREFEMSMMGELLYFLGLQIKQTTQGTFVHQMKYTKDLLRRFKMENCKPISTPIGSTAVLDPDEDGEAVDQKEYRSMIRSLLYLTASRPDIQFLVCLCARFQASPRASHRRAIKRIISCCSQILWLLSTLKDYCLTFEKVPLFCDNTSVINIAKNPVQHSRTKHIDIRFHFLRDRVEKGDVELQFLDIKLQLADIFTKPLDSNRFAFLRGELGIIHSFGMV
uniref:OSIGBa0145C12.6 protein n=1 Tax=Oryza sativa TaxID=4530 RepID=Q01J06_ORYSA|nr:OSIGBa0145C12.6 [Oryza sativa]